MQKVPSFAQKYFWDVNPNELDIEQHQRFIIERLLEQGDLDSLSWINQVYSRNDIRDIANHSRRLSPKTSNFCSLYYN